MNLKEYRYTQEHEWLCPERGTQHPTWSAGGKHHRSVRSRKRVWQVSNRSGRRLSVTCSGLGNKETLFIEKGLTNEYFWYNVLPTYSCTILSKGGDTIARARKGEAI